MNREQLEFISKYLNVARMNKDGLLIVLVMNVKGITKNFNDYPNGSVVSEYYSYKQYEEILETISFQGYQTKCYFDENDFISDIKMGILRDRYPKKLLVINSAQKGTGAGRKSLVPAFCQLHNILCASSNPYVVSFARNKYHWHCFLNNLSFPVCPSWYYSERLGWVSNKKPPVGEKVILKLNGESSGIGLTQDNVFEYDDTKDCKINDFCKMFQQDIIVEKFVRGYEAEVPVLISATECCSLEPAGISIESKQLIGDAILDYEKRGKHKFQHYNFAEIQPEIAAHLKNVTQKVALSMGIKNLGRVDYRIDEKGNFFITDIATNPHITKSMTFYYDYQNLGLTYEDVLDTLIGLSLTWENTDDFII